MMSSFCMDLVRLLRTHDLFGQNFISFFYHQKITTKCIGSLEKFSSEEFYNAPLPRALVFIHSFQLKESIAPFREPFNVLLSRCEPIFVIGSKSRFLYGPSLSLQNISFFTLKGFSQRSHFVTS